MTDGAPRVCVVTGAAGGIGDALVTRLVAADWHVVAVDTDPAIERSTRGGVTPCRGDVADRSTHERAADLARGHGRLAGWVNNAAIQIGQSAAAVDEASLRLQLDVNLVGTVWGCATAVARMDLGAVVSVSSIHARRGFPEAFVYAATKGAIVAMMRQLATEYGPRGIRANTVLPGAIATRMCFQDWESAADPAAARAADEGLHLQERMGTPEEVADVIAFLLSDQASLINGQAIAVDGGATARPPYRSGGMR